MKHCHLSRSLIVSAILCPVSVFLFCLSPREETRSRPDTETQSNPTASFIYNAIPENENASITPEYNTAINTFSVKLLHTLCITDSLADKNLIISPFNISRNLAIITEAATNETKQELLDALGGQAALDDAQEALASLLYADNSIILQIADAIWVNANSFKLIPTYTSLAESRYGVQTSELDFTDVNTTVTTINSWIENNTGHYIRDMLDDRFIDPQTACCITSAIYFKADWTSPFDVSLTTSQPFQTPSGTVETLMMMSDYQFQTVNTTEYQNARLYYGKSGKDYFYFDIYMPTTLSIAEFIAERCPEVLSGGDSIEYGGVRLPKFSFENNLDLKAALESIGIGRAFNPDLSEITAMATLKNGTDPVSLFISKIVHTAGIKTDEEGTVAYAATASTLDAGSAAPFEPVIFDQPFVYFIRAGENGLILFAGIVNDPNVSS